MYKIEREHYGIRLTFGDFINKTEMEKWLVDSEQELKSVPKPFGILIDMRTLKPLGPDTARVMQKGQAFYKQAGAQRSCVILQGAVLTMQFQRIGKESGAYTFERYISADTPNWENKAINWIANGVSPN